MGRIKYVLPRDNSYREFYIHEDHKAIIPKLDKYKDKKFNNIEELEEFVYKIVPEEYPKNYKGIKKNGMIHVENDEGFENREDKNNYIFRNELRSILYTVLLSNNFN